MPAAKHGRKRTKLPGRFGAGGARLRQCLHAVLPARSQDAGPSRIVFI